MTLVASRVLARTGAALAAGETNAQKQKACYSALCWHALGGRWLKTWQLFNGSRQATWVLLRCRLPLVLGGAWRHRFYRRSFCGLATARRRTAAYATRGALRCWFRWWQRKTLLQSLPRGPSAAHHALRCTLSPRALPVARYLHAAFPATSTPRTYRACPAARAFAVFLPSVCWRAVSPLGCLSLLSRFRSRASACRTFVTAAVLSAVPARLV